MKTKSKKQSVSFFEQVGKALDSSVDGRGFGIEELKIMNLCNAAPDLLAACKAVVENWESGDLAQAAQQCSAAIVKADGSGRITNEICSCGHLRIAHANTLAIGHGACMHSRCDCNRFTWMSRKVEGRKHVDPRASSKRKADGSNCC